MKRLSIFVCITILINGLCLILWYTTEKQLVVWVPYAYAMSFVYLLAVIGAAYSLQRMSEKLATAVMLATFVIINMCVVLMFYKLRE